MPSEQVSGTQRIQMSYPEQRSHRANRRGARAEAREAAAAARKAEREAAAAAARHARRGGKGNGRGGDTNTGTDAPNPVVLRLDLCPELCDWLALECECFTQDYQIAAFASCMHRTWVEYVDTNPQLSAMTFDSFLLGALKGVQADWNGTREHYWETNALPTYNSKNFDDYLKSLNVTHVYQPNGELVPVRSAPGQGGQATSSSSDVGAASTSPQSSDDEEILMTGAILHDKSQSSQ